MRITAIGIMSGTSLDGLDLCHAVFVFDGRSWNFDILATEFVPYDKGWREVLGGAHLLSAEQLAHWNDEFGLYSGQMVNEFLKKTRLEKPQLVCSHGHTVFHDPAKKLTLQIGNGAVIAKETGIATVWDFRSLDVSLGGQGAPLVPIGDELLFADYEACLNLGGFSNISFREDGERRAFDICPVNIVLNPLAAELGLDYDDNGVLARAGTIDKGLLAELNGLSIYKGGTRPSLAREWVEKALQPLIKAAPNSTQDKLATLTEHAAMQIGRVISSKAADGRVLVTGGGAKNGFLMERLRALSKAEIVIPKAEIVEFKEALIFAFLGVLKWRGETNVLRSVTGSERDSCSGVVSMP